MFKIHIDSYPAVNLQSDADFHFSYSTHDASIEERITDPILNEGDQNVGEDSNEDVNGDGGELGDEIVSNGQIIVDICRHPLTSAPKLIIENTLFYETAKIEIVYFDDSSRECG